MARVDAHVITAEEYAEIPELTDEQMDRADLYMGERLVRRGRPPSAAPKELIHIRLSQEVVEAFRAGGPGWQTRINDTLLDAVRKQKAGV